MKNKLAVASLALLNVCWGFVGSMQAPFFPIEAESKEWIIYLVPRKLRTRSQTNIFFCLSGQLLLKTFEILTMRETVNSSATKPVQ